METISSFPTVATLALALCILAILVLIAQTTASYLRLRHIPGPPLASISQLWLFRASLNGDLYVATRKLLRNYGSPARIGPNQIISDDPDLNRAMNAPRSRWRRGQWYKGMQLDPRIDDLLSERDEKRHTELRAKMMPGYTGREIPAMEADIDDRVLELVNLIQREAVDKSQPIDFAKCAQYFTLDSLSQLAFGQPFGFLTTNSDLYSYNASSTAFFPILELGANIPLIDSLLKSRLMQALAGPKAEDKAGLGAIIGIARKIVAERFNPDHTSKSEQPKDMLASFIRHGLTQLEAESESLLQILAGSDSTATTIRVTLLRLLTNPPIYIKVQSEIDQAVKAGRISSPVVTNAEASALPYLQACIRESLRVSPPLTGCVTKVVPPEGVTTANGVYIPGGTQVAFNHQSMGTRTDLFGADADAFRPERWFEADPETAKGYERVWELVFSYGRFTCLGKGIALMECKKAFVELLRRFDFGLVNPVNPIESKSHQIFIQRNMNLRVSARN